MRDNQPDEQQEYADYPGYAMGQEAAQQPYPEGQPPAAPLTQESSFLLTVQGQAQSAQDTVSRWEARPVRPDAAPASHDSHDSAPDAAGQHMRAKGATNSPLRARQRQSSLPDETPADQRDPMALARSTTVLPPLGDHDDTALALEVAAQRRMRSRRATGTAATGAPAGEAAEASSTAGVIGGRALMRTTGAEDRQLSVTRADGGGAALLIRGAARAPKALGRVVPQRRGSFTAQFIVAMLSAMLVAIVLTLSTPLGQSAVFGGSFHAYANAVPVIPTATPTLVPTATPAPPPGGYNPGQRVIINYIISVFGPYAQGALNVSHCESGYDPNAVNPYAIGNSHASGVFQILYPSTWDSTSYAAYSPFDYQANVRAAYQIFSRDGYSWREWQCQP